jgi:CBS domain-containing protein
MAHTLRDVMTTDIITCPSTTTLADASRIMRDHHIGDVLVTSDGRIAGIVTDRDIVVRCLADGAAPESTIDRACSTGLQTIRVDASIEDAVALMRSRSLRRLPVTENGRAVGIVSLGDLAVERDPDSALGGISAAPANI